MHNFLGSKSIPSEGEGEEEGEASSVSVDKRMIEMNIHENQDPQ